jgi:sRNA-binding carbon storage regulator CsrA
VIITVPGRAPIRLTVVDIRCGSKARIGFEAEPDISIHREEIQRLIDADAERIARHMDKSGGAGQVAG